ETRDTGAQSVSRQGTAPARSVGALTSDCGRRATSCVDAPRLPERPSRATMQVKRLEPSDHGGSEGWKVRTSSVNPGERVCVGRRGRKGARLAAGRRL